MAQGAAQATAPPEAPSLRVTPESTRENPILVTGAAGFIGFHLCLSYVKQGVRVVGYDVVNDYYDPSLKESRLRVLQEAAAGSNPPLWTFVRADLVDSNLLAEVFEDHRIRVVVHLAAQAGVRYSITNPAAYVQSNLVGFANILELCRKNKVDHLVYASSSSVYGGNKVTPFSESHGVDHPVSLYAATKKSNELMAHSYSHLFRFPTTGLRFFTVYGPWGRPDMAVAAFTKNILEDRPIELFNHGQMLRDFTYIDDIVEGVRRVVERPPRAVEVVVPASSVAMDVDAGVSDVAPYRIFNIGNSQPEPLLGFVAALENALGKTAVKVMRPMQPGDVLSTAADTARLEAATGFAPATPLAVGLQRYVEWYRGYYQPRS